MPARPHHGVLNELPATRLSELRASGGCSAVEIAEDCLRRIRLRESEVKAWAWIDPDQVLKQARARDAEPRRSLLHGIPVGIKDIIETCDLPTQFGSTIYRGHQAAVDAYCVSLLRRAGCVIMGKTETMECAICHPARTHNPVNLAHSPGGSSSGSAAAVADHMCPLALGTQAGGSIIRPASCCGVVGFKASYGLIGRAGIKPSAESLDTVGFLTRTPGDAALLASVLIPPAPGFAGADARTMRIGLCRSPAWEAAETGTLSSVADAAGVLASSGFDLCEFRLPRSFDGVADAQSTVNLYESCRAYSHEWTHFPEQISPTLRSRFEKGWSIPPEAYLAAQQLLAACRQSMQSIFSHYDVLIEPSAPGEAPVGLENAGDPVFNRIWTALHLPCVSLPVLRGASGLPLGLQIIGRMHADHKTIACADLIQQRLVKPGLQPGILPDGPVTGSIVVSGSLFAGRKSTVAVGVQSDFGGLGSFANWSAVSTTFLDRLMKASAVPDSFLNDSPERVIMPAPTRFPENESTSLLSTRKTGFFASTPAALEATFMTAETGNRLRGLNPSVSISAPERATEI